MSREEIKALAREAKNLSERANQLIRQGKFTEGHDLMRQAVEVGRRCRQIINQPKINKGLKILEKIHQS